MTTANKSSRWCWAYESTPKTAEITAVDTVTYDFGEYTDAMKDWSPPAPMKPVEQYYNYSSREPKNTKLDEQYPPFTHFYCPTTPQFLTRFLKSPATADPITIGVLDSGLTYPITIRHEQGEGTTPTLRQAVGCYTVGITMTAAYGAALTVEEKFAWCTMEDRGDRSILTTAPIASGGCDVAGTYNGTPKFTWNSTHRPEVIKVILQQEQNFETVYAPAAGTQSINCFEYNAPELLVNAVFESDVCWDDFADRAARTALLQVYKPDGSTYIAITITNALITSMKETGIKNEGHYEAQLSIVGEAISATALSCNTSFATHYKAGVT